MRLQPPKNARDFYGKICTHELIIDYIGSHRVLYNEGEETFEEYLKAHDFNDSDIPTILTLFPYEIQSMASLYLEEHFKINQTQDTK